MPLKDLVARAAYAKRHRDSHKAEMAAYKKKYYVANVEKIKRRVTKWRKTKIGAFRRKISYKASIRRMTGGDLTFEQLLGLWEAQKGKCALSGRMMLVANQGHHPDCMSIDKIKPKLGYTVSNVRLVTWQANSARGQWSDAELVSFCRDVVSASGRKKNQNQRRS